MTKPRETAPGGSGALPEPEFSRLFPVEPDLGAGSEALEFEVSAEAEERAALADRFGLLALESLSAKGVIDVFDGGESARLVALVKADVVQECVVTLDPVASHIEEELVVVYQRMEEEEETAKLGHREVEIPADEEDDVEPLPEEGVDVGVAVADCLGLALDSYPRSANADAALAELRNGEADEDSPSPFAALEKLKRQ